MIKKLLLVFINVVCFQLGMAQGTTPCNAIQLYPYTTCANTSGMQYAGHYQMETGDGTMVTLSGTSTLNPACTTDNETSQPVEWLMVTATTTSFTITNLTDYIGPGAATAETRDYAIYSGTCSSLTQIACSANIPINGTVNVTGLTAGQNYFIMVSQSAAAYTGYPSANGVATCITSTVAHSASNNNCAGAFVLANNVTYTSTNADGTADGPSVCQDPPSGSVENNVWYQWCAPSTWTPGQTAFLNVNNQICNSTQGLQLSIYDDTTNCADITAGTATSLVCQNPGATTNYNYTFTANPNQCYLIVLDGFAGTACTYSIQVSASASTCVTPPTVTATTSVDPICPSGSTTLTASCAGSCAGITYTWSPATGLSGTTGASVTANPAVTTTYTVTGTTATCTATATVTVNVNPLNTIAAGVNRTLCINTAMTNITLATTGATGATFAGLPAGVTGSWAANVATISGTPTASGTFNYTVTTTGGCPPATATGTITVNPQNTIAAGTSQTVCINTAMT
ncbi:hypothetical protein ACWPKD_14120, partial [Flavobacterium pedocola]